MDSNSSDNGSINLHDAISQDSEKINIVKTSITRSEILKEIKEMLAKAQRNVLIIAPTILDIEDLHIYTLKSSINLNIAGLVDFGAPGHEELIREIEVLANITIGNYDKRDMWALLRDGEEIIMVGLGENKDNYLFLHSTDLAHYRLFSRLAKEAWLKAKKI
jgi:sugar-specific transcriptional regulator TrmB